MKLGTTIREARRLQRWTQEELGRRARLSRQAINLLEKGGGRVSTLAAVMPHLSIAITGLDQEGSLGARVRDTRLRKRMSQAEVARKAGVSANTVAAIERDGGSVERLTRVVAAIAPRASVRVGRPHGRLSSTVSDDQHAILRDILDLYVPAGRFDLDPTYGRGGLYGKLVPEPAHRFDLHPHFEDVRRSCASSLPVGDAEVGSIMFDPPFLVRSSEGGSPAIMAERFGAFPSLTDLYRWYHACLREFHRVLKPRGVLVFKCQDTVQDHRQHLTHVWLINAAENVGFYVRDKFVLGASHRMPRTNQRMQKHARKHHSYFLVFEKRESVVTHSALWAGDKRQPL